MSASASAMAWAPPSRSLSRVFSATSARTRSTKCVFVAAALAARDDVEGDFDSVRQFEDRLFEVQTLRLEALRQHDNNASL